jgi:prepilin-type N-terminal cleavage/methylation domain-containing protein
MEQEQAIERPMRRGAPGKRQGAFSLLEMSVALSILGVLLVGVWKIIPALQGEALQAHAPEQLAWADEAIVGFVLKKSRLPCPAVNGDGKESVEDSGRCTAAVGEFPFHTLALRLPARLRYGVYQDGSASLTKVSARHVPELPPPASATTEWPLPSGTEGMSTLDHLTLVRDTTGFADADSRKNGLDFCAELRQVVLSTPSMLLLSDGIPVAYALAHPGAGDADDDGTLFDGDNVVEKTFALPGKPPQANVYDDHVLAVGFAELAGRLACPTYLARANAAAHTAYAAYYNFRLALAMLQYQAFDVDLEAFNLQQAYTGIANASMSLLGSTMSVVDGIVSAMTSSGTLAGVLATITILNSSVSEGVAIAKLVEAINKIDPIANETEGKLKKAKDKRIKAEDDARNLLALADRSAARALALDVKGLTP